MNEPIRCRPVIVRNHDVEHRFPWLHWIGALPSDEERGRVPSSSPTHPYRAGEFLRTIALDGDVDALTIGTVVAAVCAYGSLGDVDDVPASDATALLAAIANAEGLVVGGGIELLVGDEVVVTPGCCCGLEQWREWIAFAEGGEPPWCGHTGAPMIERLGSGDLAFGRHTLTPIALRTALTFVENDLRAFVIALAGWATDVAPTIADQFVAAFVREMRVAA